MLLTQAQIWQVILNDVANRNIGLIAVTHNKHLAEWVSDRIVDLIDSSTLRMVDWKSEWAGVENAANLCSCCIGFISAIT